MVTSTLSRRPQVSGHNNLLFKAKALMSETERGHPSLC